jgi:hypothetical protein
MSQHYSDPTREHDKWTLPDVEVFYMAASEFLANDGTWMAERMQEYIADAPDEIVADAFRTETAQGMAGWYYWYCFPGCMPDSDPFGPFESEQAAIDAMRDDYDY